MRIAIVEDEPRIREGIHKLLARTNDSFIVVGEAENGREGVRLILRERPDVVIADVRMPEMDGIEMIAAVQEKGQKPRGHRPKCLFRLRLRPACHEAGCSGISGEARRG